MGLEQHDHADLCWINRQAHEVTCERTLSGFSLAASPDNTKLTGAYFRLQEAGAAQVEARLNAEPSATRETLEALPGWSYFPYCILASAVL